MKTTKSIIKLGALGLLAFAIAGTPMLAQAQMAPGDTNSVSSTTNTVNKIKHKKKKIAETNAPSAMMPVAAPETTTPPALAATTNAVTKVGHNKSGVLPFHGKLKAVDTVAGTISVGTHTFVITSETIIMKNGKPATLEDGVVGDETGGAYKKTEDGKLVITKLRFGAKVAPENGGTK